jgi:hypothetical protein
MSGLVLGVVRLAALLGVCAGLTVGSATAQQPSIPSAFDRAGQPSVLLSENVVERPVWKQVTLGRHRGVNAVRTALDAARVRVGDRADEALGRPAFAFSTTPVTVDLIVLTPADLGFANGATLADVERRATQLGFELCPAEVGPLLRLAYLDQPIGEFLRVAMKPVATWGGTPVDLTVANGGTGPLLIGGESRPDLIFTSGVKFVFVRPQRIALPGVRMNEDQ